LKYPVLVLVIFAVFEISIYSSFLFLEIHCVAVFHISVF
jgi:hypothetical protein